jgi:septal ring factor EnvC (AmiA/AmiB activator)
MKSLIVLAAIIWAFLFWLCAYERYERKQEQKAAERLKETIRALQEKNKRLFDSLIQTEKATQQAEIRVKGHEITINALKRELEVKSQLLKQLDRGNGNE